MDELDTQLLATTATAGIVFNMPVCLRVCQQTKKWFWRYCDCVCLWRHLVVGWPWPWHWFQSGDGFCKLVPCTLILEWWHYGSESEVGKLPERTLSHSITW